MAERTVYRSTHPDALAAVQNAQDGHRAAEAARRALLDELGFTGRRGLITDQALIGVEHRPEDGPIPPGWRRDRRTDNAIVPDKRKAVGKAIWARLQDRALRSPNLRAMLPGGMPQRALDFDAGRSYEPGIRMIDGAVYVTWSADPELIERGDKIDPETWERIKLSVYCAAVEAEAERVEAVNDCG